MTTRAKPKPMRPEDMTAPLVVGWHYLVPTISYAYYGRRDEWPIIGPKHSDAEFFRFPSPHYHIDPRFVTATQWRFADRQARHPSALETFQGSPLCYRAIGGGDEPHPPIVRRRRKCRMAVVPYTHGHRVEVCDFRQAYAGQEAPLVQGVRICPHRGAALSSLAPGPDGCVTCPLHGLQFDLSWRVLAPITPPPTPKRSGREERK